MDRMPPPQIVVGVDGSPESRDALIWAAQHAELVGGTLRVVYAWSPPVLEALSLPPLMDWEPLRERAEDFPAAFARETLGDAPGISIVPMAVRGTPAQVLVEASEQADLLVIGSRGLGGLKGMVLGSVGHHCAAHAHCPIVIFHRQHRHERPRVRRAAYSAQSRTDASVAGGAVLSRDEIDASIDSAELEVTEPQQGGLVVRPVRSP
jgi:nucleotide-binding universal stress UspA family protein